MLKNSIFELFSLENGRKWSKIGPKMMKFFYKVIFPNWEISYRMGHVLKNSIFEQFFLKKWSKMVKIGPKVMKF